MTLRSLLVRDRPGRWREAGFALDDAGRMSAGGVTITVEPGTPAGIAAWGVEGLGAAAVDGLAGDAPARAGGPAEHPNGTLAVDHVVVVTGDLDRTTAALAAAGLHARRVREAGPVRRAFYVLGTALAEVVGPAPGAILPSELAGDDPGRARFWGLTLTVSDLDATAALLGSRLGRITDAVQPGRRIATLRAQDGPAVPIALMTQR